VGVQLPREAFHRMHMGDGDKLILTGAPEGGYRVTLYDSELERGVEIIE
jgi:hypothetical protein